MSPVDPIDDLTSRRRLAELARAHQPFLATLARKLCRGRFDPDDLVQDVLVRTVANFDRLPGDVNLAAWMARVMQNLFIDRLRSRNSAPAEVDAADVVLRAPEPDAAQWWEQVTGDQIRAAVPRLPEELREAFVLFAFERQSYRQIAAALGVPVATVGTRVLRARRHLRAMFGGDPA